MEAASLFPWILYLGFGMAFGRQVTSSQGSVVCRKKMPLAGCFGPNLDSSIHIDKLFLS